MTRPLFAALSVALLSLPALAQRAPAKAASSTAIVADTSESDEADVGEGKPGLQYGLASGGLKYPGGRTEQGFGGVLRWVPLQWLSLSATPTAVRVHEPSAGGLAAISRTGLVDLPLEASLSHAFKAHYSPTVSFGLGASLPVGDTASGFGSGAAGYSASLGAGFAPADNIWMHASAGRSLGGLSAQSAFASGTGWADVSGGTSITPRVSVGGGYSSDFGAIDPTIGRSTSVSGNVAFTLTGATTFNVSGTRGLSGAAPDYSISLAVGTAFPYLNHLGAGSALSALRTMAGGGSHGLRKSGSSTTTTTSGRRRP